MALELVENPRSRAGFPLRPHRDSRILALCRQNSLEPLMILNTSFSSPELMANGERWPMATGN